MLTDLLAALPHSLNVEKTPRCPVDNGHDEGFVFSDQ
jgi:hypothetical protein